MEPKSFSATALNVAQLCLSRYATEHINRGKGISGGAATLGSACHGALEMYIKATHLDAQEPPTLKLLLDFFSISYLDHFGNLDKSGAPYIDGVEMLTRWHGRTSFEGRRVVSCEVKTSFPIKTSIGAIPFNYIWDRFDQLGDDEYEVVDYKTNRWPMTPDELRGKVQARCYGLAAQIQYPNAKRIWVRFDLLRHDDVAVSFSREDNAETWRFLKTQAERIIATPADKAPETLNDECRFCPRKHSCFALKRNVEHGGIFTISGIDEAIERRLSYEQQQKALKSAMDELDKMIESEARAMDVFEYSTDSATLGFKMSSRREVDAKRVQEVIGLDLFNQYGGLSLNLTDYNKLLKDTRITEAQRDTLKTFVSKTTGEPKVAVKPKGPFTP